MVVYLVKHQTQILIIPNQSMYAFEFWTDRHCVLVNCKSFFCKIETCYLNILHFNEELLTKLLLLLIFLLCWLHDSHSKKKKKQKESLNGLDWNLRDTIYSNMMTIRLKNCITHSLSLIWIVNYKIYGLSCSRVTL